MAATVIAAMTTLVIVDSDALLSDPLPAMAAVAVLVTVASFASVLGRSDLTQRARASIDPLTGVLNRSTLPDRFAEVREQALAIERPVSMLLADLDHFKAVNDEHGHLRGDAVLREVAFIARQQTRSFELIYRYGGEEFLILLPGADGAHAFALAEAVRHAVHVARPGDLDVTVSIGVATLAGERLALGALCELADRALYQAKHAGRDRVVAWTDELARPDSGLEQLPTELVR